MEAKKLGVAMALVAGLAGSGAVSASVIYDNNAVPTSAMTSDRMIGYFAADNFTLVQGLNSVTDLHWTGGYIHLVGSPSDGTAPQSDDFRVRIFSDNNGFAPNQDPIHTLALNDLTRTNAGTVTIHLTATLDVNITLYDYSATVQPLTLDPNTPFWLSIDNATSISGDQWVWAFQSVPNDRFAYRVPVNVGWGGDAGRRFDFQLTNDNTVPEPATLALLGMGLASLGFARGRRA